MPAEEIKPNAVIKFTDMDIALQEEAKLVAQEALTKYYDEKAMADHIKKHFDTKHNPTWHVAVGRNFGAYVTHEQGMYIYFYIGQTGFLLFKL